MSDLILSLPHHHRHIAIYAVQIIKTILDRMCFFAFYIAVRCGFDKHLYITSCLNAHNHNTCLLNTYTWRCHLKTKAMSIVNFSDHQKTSKWQKNSVLVKNVFYVIHFYYIRASPICTQGILYEGTLFSL